MRKHRHSLLPRHERILKAIGKHIRRARICSGLSGAHIAASAGISRATLYILEDGHPGVSIGNLLRVLDVLDLDEDLLPLANDNILGLRKLRASELKNPRKRPPK